MAKHSHDSCCAHDGEEAVYGHQFEGGLIIFLAALVLASLVGAYQLYRHYQPSCKISDYTYCGEVESKGHE